MIVFLFSLFAALSGLIEAVLYARRGAESFTRNEHVEMVLQRGSVVLLVVAAVYLPDLLHISKHYVAFELLPALLLFPMVHDEAYNFSRLWLRHRELIDGMLPVTQQMGIAAWGSLDRWALAKARAAYEYGYQSPTTTARNDFNGQERTLMAIAAGIIWVVGALIIL